MCDECPDIIQEVRRNREKIAARFNHDLEAMFKFFRKEQERSGLKLVSFPARKPKQIENKT